MKKLLIVLGFLLILTLASVSIAMPIKIHKPIEVPSRAPLFVLDDFSPTSDNLLMTSLIAELQHDGHDFPVGAVKLDSEVTRDMIHSRVTTVIYKGKAAVIVGAYCNGQQNIFATDVAMKLQEMGVPVRTPILLSTELTSDELHKAAIFKTPVEEIEEMVCGETYSKNDKFRLNSVPFEYKGAHDLDNPFIPALTFAKFKNLRSGETNERATSEKAVFNMKADGIEYGFQSVSNFMQDDYDITLRYPCNLEELRCGEVIRKNDQFTLGDHTLEYKGADDMGATPLRQVMFKHLESGETFVREAHTAAVFYMAVRGTRFVMESASDITQDNFDIKLVHPCQ